jgi:hypothetical protein
MTLKKTRRVKRTTKKALSLNEQAVLDASEPVTKRPTLEEIRERIALKGGSLSRAAIGQILKRLERKGVLPEQGSAA